MILQELYTAVNAKRLSSGKEKVDLVDFFTSIFSMHDRGVVSLYETNNENGGEWHVESNS